MMKKLLALIPLLLLAATDANAVTQYGNVTAGNCASWQGNQTVKDAGFACTGSGGGPFLPLAGGTMAANAPVHFNQGTIDGANSYYMQDTGHGVGLKMSYVTAFGGYPGFTSDQGYSVMMGGIIMKDDPAHGGDPAYLYFSNANETFQQNITANDTDGLQFNDAGGGFTFSNTIFANGQLAISANTNQNNSGTGLAYSSSAEISGGSSPNKWYAQLTDMTNSRSGFFSDLAPNNSPTLTATLIDGNLFNAGTFINNSNNTQFYAASSVSGAAFYAQDNSNHEIFGPNGTQSLNATGLAYFQDSFSNNVNATLANPSDSGFASLPVAAYFTAGGNFNARFGIASDAAGSLGDGTHTIVMADGTDAMEAGDGINHITLLNSMAGIDINFNSSSVNAINSFDTLSNNFVDINTGSTDAGAINSNVGADFGDSPGSVYESKLAFQSSGFAGKFTDNSGMGDSTLLADGSHSINATGPANFQGNGGAATIQGVINIQGSSNVGSTPAFATAINTTTNYAIDVLNGYSAVATQNATSGYIANLNDSLTGAAYFADNGASGRAIFANGRNVMTLVDTTITNSSMTYGQGTGMDVTYNNMFTANFANSTYAGQLLDGTNTINIANTTYGLNGTGNGYTVNLLDSNNNAAIWSQDGTGNIAYFAWGGGAGYYQDTNNNKAWAADGTNGFRAWSGPTNQYQVQLADSTDGWAGAFINGTNQTYIGQSGQGIYSTSATSGPHYTAYLADANDGAGGYFAYAFTYKALLGQNGKAANFTDGTRTVNIADGTNAIAISGGPLNVAANNIVTDTSTGTKIGTATGQKLGFFNATPVVQQSGNIVTGLSNLGLVTSGTLSASNLPAGTLNGSSGTPTCGTGCSSITAGSTNARGSATSGTLASSVTVNWSGTLSSTPWCVCSSTSVSATTGCTSSTTALTINLSTGLTGDVITWMCSF